MEEQSSFDKSKEEGDIGEQIVHLMFSNAGGSTSGSSKEDRYKYDVSITYDDLSFLCEVKTDLASAKWGNVAIEYANTRRSNDKNDWLPSGITSTSSDIWCHVIPTSQDVVIDIDNSDSYQVWFAKVVDLLHHVRNVKGDRSDSIHGGDGNAAMRLYKKSNVLNGKLFKRADNLNQEELLRLVNGLLG